MSSSSDVSDKGEQGYELSHIGGLMRLKTTEKGLRAMPESWVKDCLEEKVEWLDLSESGINTLPDSLADNDLNLQCLDLSYNALTRVPPVVYKLNRTLRKLNLSGNDLTELPEDINELTDLEELNIDSNSSLKKLPCTMGQRLSRLKSFNCKNTGLPWEQLHDDGWLLREWQLAQFRIQALPMNQDGEPVVCTLVIYEMMNKEKVTGQGSSANGHLSFCGQIQANGHCCTPISVSSLENNLPVLHCCQSLILFGGYSFSEKILNELKQQSKCPVVNIKLSNEVDPQPSTNELLSDINSINYHNDNVKEVIPFLNQKINRRKRKSEPTDDEKLVKKPRTSTKDKPVALLVIDEWGTSKGGISAINRQLACQVLRGHFKVYCMVVKVSQAEREDAKKHGVTLIEPKEKGYEDRDASFDCLRFWESYFEEILRSKLKPKKVKVIIGHGDITHDTALEIKKKLYPQAKLASFYHVIHEDTEWLKKNKPSVMKKKEDGMYQHAQDKEVDIIVSVGPRIHKHFSRRLAISNKSHLQYLPYPEPKFWAKSVSFPKPDAPVRILTFGRVYKVSKLKGYDLLACAMGKLAEAYHNWKADSPPEWIICGVPDDEVTKTENFLLKYVNSSHLDIKIHPYVTHDDIINELQNCHVCLMGSRTEPFGLVGLEAIVMGVPTLITSVSGLAKLLLNYFKKDGGGHCVVEMPPTLKAGGCDFNNVADDWKDKILNIIKDPKPAFKAADKLKHAFLNAAEKKTGCIAKSHRELIECLKLSVNPNPQISTQKK